MRPERQYMKNSHANASFVARLIPLFALTFITIAVGVSYAAPAKRQTDPPKIQIAAQTPNGSADADAIEGIIANYAKSIDAADKTLASQIW